MAYTDINSEDRLVQATFAEHLVAELVGLAVVVMEGERNGAHYRLVVEE